MADQTTDQTNNRNGNGVSASEKIKVIEAEIKDLTRQKEDHEIKVRELMQSEDPVSGKFYAQEIFQHKQDKLRLEVELDWRQKRINRLTRGMEEFT